MTIDNIRSKIDSVSRELAENKGRMESARQELRELVGTDDPDKAGKAIRKLEAELAERTESINDEAQALGQAITDIQRKLAERDTL